MPESLNKEGTETRGTPLTNQDEAYVVHTGERKRFSSFFNKKIIRLLIGVFLLLQIVIFSVFFVLPRIKDRTAKQVTLTYWGLWEPETVFSSVISDFERQHPHITIKYEKQDIKFLGKYMERLRTRIQNNTGPDLFRFHNSWLPQIRDFMLPFPSDLVGASDLATDKYYDVIKQDLSFRGAFYGVPLHIDTLTLFANDDIFKAAGVNTRPSTWDDLWLISRQLTVKDEAGSIKTAGVAMGTFDNVVHASDILSLLFVQNGADIRNLEGESRKNAQDALDFYVSFAKGVDNVWSQEMETSKLAFAKGKLALFFGYSWDVFDIKALNPKLNVTLLPVPHLPGRNTTIASYWAEGVAVNTKHPKEAFEFLKFLSKKETLQRLYEQQSKIRLFGELYPRTDMAPLLKDNPYGYVVVQQARDAVSTPFSSETFDEGMNAALNAYLGNAVRAVFSSSVTSASAIETLRSGIEQVLSKYD